MTTKPTEPKPTEIDAASLTEVAVPGVERSRGACRHSHGRESAALRYRRTARRPGRASTCAGGPRGARFRARRCAALLLLLAAAPVLWGDDDVVAVIGGEPVLQDELLVAAALSLEQSDRALLRCQHEAMRSRHEALEGALRELVWQRLLEREAERTATAATALLAGVDATAQPVGEQDIKTFYERNRARIRGTLEQTGGQIRAYLERQAQQRARGDFFSALEKRFAVEYRLAPLRFEVAADGFPAVGPPDAAVTLVEFSDFECPFCARFLPALERAKQEYAGKLRVVYRHFPLSSIHPRAQKAAEASLCAAEQGRFWELHDLMFAEQQALEVPDLKEKARRLGLDGEQFDRCLDEGRQAEAVREDYRDGEALGITGTPALFVNGRLLSGAVPFERLAEVIDDELARLEADAR